jgi:hypothetical protein
MSLEPLIPYHLSDDGSLSKVTILQTAHDGEGITIQQCQHRNKTLVAKTISQWEDGSKDHHKAENTII